MTIYGAPPGRRCCCECGADVTDDGPAGTVMDACGWPLHYCGACWGEGASPPNPVEAFSALAAASGGRWDNVDAERYVAHMRDKCDDACEFCAEEREG